MPTEAELLKRIQELEEMNSVLQDKLDAIYSIVSDDEPADELVQIGQIPN